MSVSHMSISENTLKYHNRNIYGKPGVASRKELLMYATIRDRSDTPESK